MSLGKLKPPHPPIPPMSSSVPPKEAPPTWGGDAMDTLKMKIGLLTRDNSEAMAKMALAEQAKEEAETRIKAAEEKIREQGKKIQSIKIKADYNNDLYQKNSKTCRRKEEALVAAKEEIQNLTIREGELKNELERVHAALPATSEKLCETSANADKQLSDVKNLELRAMIADQTVEEMEEQLELAVNMAATTNHKAEEMLRKLEMREAELKKAESRANTVQNHLDSINDKLRASDKKMNAQQFNLEERVQRERKYKKELALLQARITETEARKERDVEALKVLKHHVDLRIKKAAKAKK
eukprot:TRINITY_DN41394_c0_g1_i1.p1 TRINITY_DN41394_c0_g1~~TRINITY_DN41394_c0_g1_i1.p1  ORF type:complete len:310 (-),score=114.98 TRINITY_DN41394_c0_g1_i1:194-1090(-)